MADAPPLRILLVDDDPDDELLTREVLLAIPDFPFTLKWVTNAAEGLAAILADEHDVYLLDRQLGGDDGLELVQKARQAGSQSPLLLLTGSGSREVDQAAMAAGASDYLPKGELTPGNLERAVRHAIDRARMLSRLQARSAELARSNRELEEFAAVISHDLRSPMQTIAAHAELLEHRYQGRLDAGADLMIERLVAGVMRLERMLTELLSFARVSQPTIYADAAPLDSCLDIAIQDVRQELLDCGGVVHRSGPLPSLPGNATLLTQLFTNLLANAVKFRSERPLRIEVGAERTFGGWVIAISDNGIGIPAGELQQTFMIFQRGHGTIDRPGTGIGLAICKKIVERHGGWIAAASLPAGGARISFLLPTHAPEPLSPTEREPAD